MSAPLAMAPVAQTGWPAPAWAVVPTDDGHVGLRIAERRLITGMIDLAPGEARALARSLETVANQIDAAPTEAG